MTPTKISAGILRPVLAASLLALLLLRLLWERYEHQTKRQRDWL